MAKKLVKARTRRSLLKGIALVGIALVLSTVIFSNITVGSDAPEYWANFVQFFKDVRSNIVDNASFYAIATGLAALIVIGFRKYILNK